MKRERVYAYAIRYQQKGIIGGFSHEHCIKQLSTYIPDNIDLSNVERGYLTTLDRFLPHNILQEYIRDNAIEIEYWINPQ